MRKFFTKPGRPGVLFDESGNELTMAQIALMEESAPLAEFNRLAEKSNAKPEAPDALVAAWQDFGLSEPAAKIAAAVQAEEFAPKTADEIDWANLSWGQ